MAEPANFPLTIKRGADLYIEIECYQSDGVTPLDISTFTFDGDIKTDPNSGVVASFSVGCKSGTTTILYIDIPAAVSETLLTAGATLADTEIYYHDIKVDTGSVIEYWFQGELTVIPRVTV